MNVSSFSSILAAYENNPVKKEEKVPKVPRKADVVELSNKIPPERMKKYLDGSFLDDPEFSDKFETFITNYF